MRSDMTETVCEHSKQTLQLDENYYPATFQMACLEAVDKNYQNAKNKFEEIAVLVQGNINHQDWCGLSLKEVLYVFRCNIWIAKIALIEAGESSIGLPVATAKNSAFAFIKTPILEKCCTAEHYLDANEYLKGSIVARAIIFILQDMIGTSEVNKELREEIESMSSDIIQCEET